MSDEVLFHREFAVLGGDFSAAGTVSTQIKSILQEIGFEPPIIRRAAIASYEAEMNVVMYAERAVVRLSAEPNKIRIEFDDQGSGIPDIGLAMQEGYSTATHQMREMGFGAGMGLPNIKKNADNLEITSEPGKGTRLEITILTE
jgi:anti-sigma regulatory factor (Ser/Thr protein kinase)